MKLCGVQVCGVLLLGSSCGYVGYDGLWAMLGVLWECWVC